MVTRSWSRSTRSAAPVTPATGPASTRPSSPNRSKPPAGAARRALDRKPAPDRSPAPDIWGEKAGRGAKRHVTAPRGGKHQRVLAKKPLRLVRHLVFAGVFARSEAGAGSVSHYD